MCIRRATGPLCIRGLTSTPKAGSPETTDNNGGIMTVANGSTALLTRAAPTQRDPLDGKFSIDLPSERALRAYWDVDIIDYADQKHRVIEANDPFTVPFRLQLACS